MFEMHCLNLTTFEVWRAYCEWKILLHRRLIWSKKYTRFRCFHTSNTFWNAAMLFLSWLAITNSSILRDETSVIANGRSYIHEYMLHFSCKLTRIHVCPISYFTFLDIDEGITSNSHDRRRYKLQYYDDWYTFFPNGFIVSLNTKTSMLSSLSYLTCKKLLTENWKTIFTKPAMEKFDISQNLAIHRRRSYELFGQNGIKSCVLCRRTRMEESRCGQVVRDLDWCSLYLYNLCWGSLLAAIPVAAVLPIDPDHRLSFHRKIQSLCTTPSGEYLHTMFQNIRTHAHRIQTWPE